VVFHDLLRTPIDLQSAEHVACAKAYNVQFWKSEVASNGFYGPYTEGAWYLPSALSTYLLGPDSNRTDFVVVELGASESGCCTVRHQTARPRRTRLGEQLTTRHTLGNTKKRRTVASLRHSMHGICVLVKAIAGASPGTCTAT
jgi:hypothetical protein